MVDKQCNICGVIFNSDEVIIIKKEKCYCSWECMYANR